MYPYHHVRSEDGRESLTVFMPEGTPVVATADHPHFAELLEAAQTDIAPGELRGLADLSTAVAQRFDQLSQRVAVANGRVYFDGDEVDSAITRQIIRALEDPDAGDWRPLVRFMENVAANPNEHSREQLFSWLHDREFTITTDGCFIAYKGVRFDEDDNYVSSSAGHGIVNGERHEGQLPNPVGAVVEMPRSDVQHDPERGCSTGLHVGTYEYAQTYARAALLTVLVNPRDVVSVPTDCNAEKMRVCRYVVSDDEPTPPDESPAIERPKRYVPFPDSLPFYSDIADEWETTGIVRPPAAGDYYLLEGHVQMSHHQHEDPELILAPVAREPRVFRDLLGNASVYDGHTEFVLNGEVRGACEGEFYTPAEGQPYAGKVCRAAYTHDSLVQERILVPKESEAIDIGPDHGDYDSILGYFCEGCGHWFKCETYSEFESEHPSR